MTQCDPALVRLQEELADVGTTTEGLHGRAEEVLEALGRILPFDSGWLAVRDPERRRHVPLATTGEAEPLRRYFESPGADAELEDLGLNRAQRPVLASELPLPLPEICAWGEYLLPAGFRGGVAGRCRLDRAARGFPQPAGRGPGAPRRRRPADPRRRHEGDRGRSGPDAGDRHDRQDGRDRRGRRGAHPRWRCPPPARAARRPSAGPRLADPRRGPARALRRWPLHRLPRANDGPGRRTAGAGHRTGLRTPRPRPAVGRSAAVLPREPARPHPLDLRVLGHLVGTTQVSALAAALHVDLGTTTRPSAGPRRHSTSPTSRPLPRGRCAQACASRPR